MNGETDDARVHRVWLAAALIGASLVDVAILLERLAETSTVAPIQAERVRIWLQRHAR